MRSCGSEARFFRCFAGPLIESQLAVVKIDCLSLYVPYFLLACLLLLLLPGAAAEGRASQTDRQ